MSEPDAQRPSLLTSIKAQLKASAIDLSLLRNNKNLAILFYSGLISRLGSMITYVALPFQIKELTNSYLAVGLMGAAELIPLIVFGLYGGVLADALDRKKLIIIGEVSAFALSLLLLINSQLATPQLWICYLVAAAFSAVNGITSPSYNAAIPQIVAHEDLPKASALMGLRWQVAVSLDLPSADSSSPIGVWQPDTLLMSSATASPSRSYSDSPLLPEVQNGHRHH